MRPLRAACAAVAVAAGILGGTASAQNDWQFPDPYFGILEIEKSHTPAAERRYRTEITPDSRPGPTRPRPQRSRRRHVRQVQR